MAGPWGGDPEIVVVTLPDLAGRAAMQVARDIGRQWGVGATGQAGDRARNAGVILLLKPGQRPGLGVGVKIGSRRLKLNECAGRAISSFSF